MTSTKFRKISVLFLVAIYLNALAISLKSECYDDNIYSNNTTSLEWLKDLNVRLIATISQSFIDFKDFKNDRLHNYDNPLGCFNSILKNNSHFKLKSISIYISDSKNIVIKYRKQNYIYPFHYFW